MLALGRTAAFRRSMTSGAGVATMHSIASGSLVQCDIVDSVATVRLNRPKVNSLNLELLTALNETLVALEGNKSVRGLILTSASPGVFCAGLDIKEMWKPDPERVRSFWSAFQHAHLNLYKSRLPTVAAINGASPAGGCMLAMSCDYRVMHDQSGIGLNETKLGIVAPPWLVRLFVNTVGRTQAELHLKLGSIIAAPEAKAIGLVDDLAPLDAVQERAEGKMAEFLQIPPPAFSMTKLALRQTDVSAMKKSLGEDLEAFTAFVQQPVVQGALDNYMAMLAAKSKAKKSKM